ncbi:hypothetical protein [Oceanospirillum linum]|uniref:Uncharacterized protein n=1 Tax=Oceanospirillum linum TaxID=966 RepID=A0A1T1HB05_OCELI|nr:hypothetical protein [Oceanospirillum linum]OOV87048.1 hypothetical protein BTA35_0208545 [Oceanospirillum linum]SEF72786.1 hypothetical protein SAMN04489856_102106 [Oleiphilus messinensis]SMP16092.1 hypothetical protein SAMN06264348_103104 [Oceanospirillum linum]
MNWSKAMAVGYVASIVLGAVIGGSFAPAWSGYVVLTGLALLPLIIFLKPEALQSMSRHHFAEKFKMAFGGISAWLWGIVIFSTAGSVLLAVTDTEKSGTHELVTPILQSIVAAFVFYVIDVNYSRNQKQKHAYKLSYRFLRNITHHAKSLIVHLCEIQEFPIEIYDGYLKNKLIWKPEFDIFFSILDGAKEHRYCAYDRTVTPHKMCNTQELLWRHYQSIQKNIAKSNRWYGSVIGDEYIQVLMEIDSCYLIQEYIPTFCDPESPYRIPPEKSNPSIPQYFCEYIILCQKLEQLLDKDIVD